jgi:hypothetical protein
MALLMYLGFGTLVGEVNGSINHDLVILFGNALWTIIFTPMYLPALRTVRKISLTSKER